MEMCLVYVSTATVPPEGGDLIALLRQSRRNNLRDGITGLLLYKDRRFMQALEGTPEAVLPLYRRIALDARHAHVTTLIKFAIPARSFPDWSMGFADIDGISEEDRTGLSPFLEPSFDSAAYLEAPHQAVRLLQRFKEMNAVQGAPAGS